MTPPNPNFILTSIENFIGQKKVILCMPKINTLGDFRIKIILKKDCSFKKGEKTLLST